MSEGAFDVGDDVYAAGYRGIVIDIRETSDGGRTVYGVEDLTGGVNFYTARGLRLATE
ncbi:hypothetical protein [Homoserinibacter gongjuensis]|uniref:DUF4926 domain-containing protein n=1 Tax=Homoserinibacter gongjuensis TaxID=1162968 RepID=A0ABQ6JSG1_9MICO|nr:hypothetical protein [Homoserinibacter gongjuensis]GMA89620.1 hypothetical protein GCM10025869_01490 [Homoserinibacter gongjuensis]